MAILVMVESFCWQDFSILPTYDLFKKFNYNKYKQSTFFVSPDKILQNVK